MKFVIKCNALMRFSKMMKAAQPEEIRFIRLENRQGKAYMIATNQKLAIVEFLGTTTERDGAMHLVPDDVLLAQLQFEAMMYDGLIQFVYTPEFNAVHVMTTSSWNWPNPAVSTPAKDSPLNGWVNWIPKELPNYGRGRIQLDGKELALLAECSPSGTVVLPTFPNSLYKMVMRDMKYDTWMGILKVEEWANTTKPWDLFPDWWTR